MDDVEDPRDPEFVHAAQPHGARQDLANLLVGQRPVRIDEGQRHLPIQCSVQRLPELQVRRAAVEDQQPVATAGDAGAGNQVQGVLTGRWFGCRLHRITGGAELRRFEVGIRGWSAVGPRRRLRRRDGADLKIGRHVGLEIISGGFGDSLG